MTNYIFSLIIFVTVGSLAQAHESKVVIRPHTFVSANELKLGDIAEFVGLTSSQIKYLKEIPLGDVPVYGEKRTFSNQGLSEVLRAQMRSLETKDVGFAKIKMQIPTEVSIENK
jgi:hypothetical protein